jgi:hypothetical protein
MNSFLHYLVVNKTVIIATALVFIKWIYNAWTDGVTFPQFIRQFIGEIVQEAPTSFKLNADQVKLLAAHAEGKVKIVDLPLTKVDSTSA